MSCKPDTKTTKAMYDLYQQGFSLAQVGTAFGVSRQTVFKRFSRRGYLMRTVEPLPFILFAGHKYTRRANGYYGRTEAERTLLHRDMWEAENGTIPPGYDVHHVDTNRTHNVIDNFELITKSEHSSKYPHRQNQYTVRDRYIRHKATKL